MKRRNGAGGRQLFLAISVCLAGVVGVTPAIATIPATTQVSGGETHTTSVGGLSLPQYIGPLEFIGETSGEEPGTMATYSYRAIGLALDIHVQDFGAGGIADGIDAAVLASHFAQTQQTLREATDARGLDSHEAIVPLAQGDARSVREAVYRLKPQRQSQDQGHDESVGGTTYLWFTAQHGLLIDARFDAALGFEEDADIGRGEILAALGDAIPGSAAPVVAARARAARAADDASMRVSILWDPETPEEESKIWLAYLFARAAFAANETDGGPAVGERESTFEEEVRGRTIALTTFRALKRESAQPASEYFNDIDRVEAAGFLREYVWRYLRHASWHVAPEGLDLTGFDAWRAEHLADHKAITHGRIAFRLASAQ